MLNLLSDYISDSLPTVGDLCTNPNLCKKADTRGGFLPFFGNTVVFDLDRETKNALQVLQDELYRSAGRMLSRRLDPGTFHMTLHDLVNGPELTDGLKQRMAAAEAGAKSLLPHWKAQPPLHMKATWLFNMVNTSIVLGLAPGDDASWHALDAMYTALEAVVPLGYALTPHITMAYFRPGTYTQYDLAHLRQALHPVDLDIQLRMEALVYQEFSDMNRYETK